MMVKKGKIPSELWETYRAMSVDVASIEMFKFLGETACMNVEERKMIAYCEIAKKLFPDDEKFVGFLDEVAKPFFEYIGRAKWDRDIVTDLGFALSKQSGKRKDLSKVLTFEPKR